jgi:tetratricopeptide (TPR) repeat protein
MYLRKVVALQSGDLDAAERYRKHAEILAVQTAVPQMFTVMLPAELNAHVLAGDLRGVQQIAERMASLAETAPGWVPFMRLARASFLRMRGNLADAKLEFERYLNQGDPRVEQPGGVLAWTAFAAAYVDVLIELGQCERALSWGLSALATLQELAVENDAPLQRVIALAEAKCGDHAGAVARLERVIAAQRALGISGVHLGASYEARMRVAIWAKEPAAIEAYASLIAREYRHGVGSTLGARYERLLEEVERSGLGGCASLAQLVDDRVGSTSAATHSAFSVVAEQLGTRSLRDERSHRALRLLCEAHGSDRGQLYLCAEDGLQLAASLDTAFSPRLQQAAQACLERHLAQGEGETALLSAPKPDDAEPSDAIEAGVSYRFGVLTTRNAVCVGVFGLKIALGSASHVAPRALLEAVAGYFARADGESGEA